MLLGLCYLSSYPAFPVLLLPSPEVCRVTGSTAGRAEAAVRGLPAEMVPSKAAATSWAGKQLHQPPAPLGWGARGLQHPRGDGGLVESMAGLPRQTLPLCTINSPPVSARTSSLHWHPRTCRHNTSADTPTPQGTLSLVTPNALPAPDPKGHREVFL